MQIMTNVAAHETTQSITHLLPILVHIQNHLDLDLSLTNLAQRACFSDFHFHRMFKQHVGETLKSYTQRLRLERAAFHLHLHSSNVTEIAFEMGFSNPETFSRAFKRRFGMAPNHYRQSTFPTSPQETPKNAINAFTQQYQLSQTTVKPLKSIHLAFIRNTGPYVDVDPGLFDELLTWRTRHQKESLPTQLIGIGHDAPGITPNHQLRFDACLHVPYPFQPQGRVAHQLLPAGDYAVTTYIGPLGQTLVEAYVQVGQQLRELRNIEIIGLPVIEIYRETRINPEYGLNHTDICIPVKRL